MRNSDVKPSQAKAQPCQSLPKGHFDSDGVSQGSKSGAVRKSWDAYLSQREEQRQEGDRPAGPRP